MEKYKQLTIFDKENQVIQDNRIIMAKYDMTMLEQKIFLILVSTIKKEDKVFKDTIFKVTDLALILGISADNLYRDLKKVCNSLVDKKVNIQKNDDGWLIAPLMKSAEYFPKQGEIALCLNEKLEPYFLQLQKFFTGFELNNVLELSGKYSIRIYQLSKSNLYKNEFTITLDDFKEQLELKAKSYNEFKAINSKVIKPSVEEINNKTDIFIEISTIKQGKSVKQLKFTINKRNIDKIKYVAITDNKNKNDNIKQKGNFNNYPQRNYDFDELEKKLLGWNK